MVSEAKKTKRNSQHVPAKPRGKYLPRGLATDTPICVPARMVSETLYCERAMYLEWVQGEFDDNAFTVDGRFVHRVADKPGGKLPRQPAPEVAAASTNGPGRDTAVGNVEVGEADVDKTREQYDSRPTVARSVWLTSHELRLTAKIDVLEIDGTRVAPIEYKRGKKPDLEEGARLTQRVQLCAQVLLLRTHGFTCEEAWIYFDGDRRRVAIDISNELITATHEAIKRALQLVQRGKLPPPLLDSPKCHGCSLIGICLPDEVAHLQKSSGDSPPMKEGLRRLHPARDDRNPMYVQKQGARVGIKSDRLTVTMRKEKLMEMRIKDTSQVNLMGNVQVSTQALKRLLQRNIPIQFFSYGGWHLGRAIGHHRKNVELRIAQFAAAADTERCLALAKRFVCGKVTNCRILLRRNHKGGAAKVLKQLKHLGRKVDHCTSLESLLGIEGSAARIYFGKFTGMLTDAAAKESTFDLNQRNRRPPRDPMNALLSFCYALLVKDFTVAATAAGLDPMLGFYHQPRFGRPALALDMMEEFRPLVADSTVITVINNGIVTASDFVCAANAVAIRPAARRRVIEAYERRMRQLIVHPVFGYRISYRRTLEVQMRLLGRHLLGDIDDYPTFTTR